ncbi:MAG: hypothetical protein E7579_09265 [Ruminococcaceae bacterium]|nr:hypothetical protein [Oscillospiraceae bacterium]
MTELEKMQRARMYLDKLANGINPLDDTMLPEEDIVNNVRITRCLHYVSEVLGQVIENGGTEFPEHKIPFAVSNEQLAGYPMADHPIQISEFVSRVNALVDTRRMRKLSPTTITAWLVSEELLYVVARPDGKTSKLPTENGYRFGISTETRMGAGGEYTALLYNSYAQMYILKNMQYILDNKRANLKSSER